MTECPTWFVLFTGRFRHIFFGLLRIYELYNESRKIDENIVNKNCSFWKGFTLYVTQQIHLWFWIFSPGTQVTLSHNLVPKFLLSNCLLLGLSFSFFNCWEILSWNLVASTQNLMTLVTLLCSSELEKYSPIEPTLHTPFSQIWKNLFYQFSFGKQACQQ